jgi:glycosyl transferase family 21
MSTIAASYVLPLRASTPDPELRDYVRWLAETVADVLVVDASPDEVRAVHEGWWGTWVRHLPPDPARHCRNGKVWGVLTGLDRARHDVVVIADDDVRWDRDGLRRVVDLLESTELVAPANYYDPLPWHARYDTGRVLVQRALGGDWPGTLALRLHILAAAGGGYDG